MQLFDIFQELFPNRVESRLKSTCSLGTSKLFYVIFEEKINMDIESLRYPLGKWVVPSVYTPEILNGWINDIEALPQILISLTGNLDPHSLAQTYRPGGWSVKQLIHHLADSHLNAYIRNKLAYTEDNPVIKPYDENEWVLTADAVSDDINTSLQILKGVHGRWGMFLKSLDQSDFERTIFHPEHKKTMSISFLTGMYAWHGRHHTAHIKIAIGAG